LGAAITGREASISAACEEKRFEARWQVSTQYRRPREHQGWHRYSR
jgi:hypothetical protein